MKFFVLCLTLLLTAQTFGQKSVFVSSVDSDLTIKSVGVLPMVDNVAGIYSKPLSAHLLSLLADDKQWSANEIVDKQNSTPESYEDHSALAKTLLSKNKVDGFISSRLTKGPQGVTLRLNLFSGKEGLLTAQAIMSNYTGYEVADLRTQLSGLYKELKSKIPYDGVLLSRKGTLVTVNVGSKQGLSENQDLNVIQIVKVQRHPKFNFIVSTDKEILGRVRLKKVEEFLSFGTIVSERDEGVLKPGHKLIVEQFIKYPETPMTADQKIIDALGSRKDQPLAFGDKAGEWVPDKTPTFGKIAVLLGLTQYSLSSNLATSGGLSASNSLVPTIKLDGEMWLSPEWFGAMSLRQYVFSVSNPNGSGSPSKLNVSTSQYSLLAGYNFLIADQFFGPKLQLSAGYSKFSSTVDQSSPLTAFTSQSYSGLMFGLGGSFPLDLESKTPVSLGAKINLFFNPALDESPVDSGSCRNNITSFSGFVDIRQSHRLNYKFVIDYDLFASSFTGTGSRGEVASSSSHSMMSVLGGIEYLF
jgi:hypothetical protein